MKFACPHCGQHIEAEEEWAGIQTDCPTCTQQLTVPHPSGVPPPIAPPTFVFPTIRNQELSPGTLINFEFPKWILQLDPTITQRASDVLRQSELTEITGRDLLKQWSSKNFFAKKDLFKEDIAFTVHNSIVIKIEQVRHHEERSLVTTTEPDTGQRHGKETTSEGLWDKNAIEKFKNKSVKWVRGGSGRSRTCNYCNGRGKNTCSSCKGNPKTTCSSCSGNGVVSCKKCSGKGALPMTCPNCRGKGSIPKSGIAVGGTIRGGLGAGVVFSDEQCQRCSATGIVVSQCEKCSGKGRLDCFWCSGTGICTCSTCNGTGTVVCTTCKSAGRLYSFDVISATARNLKQQFLLGFSPPMKQSWFKRLKNVDSQIFEIGNPLSIDSDPNPPPKEGRVLYERYIVEIVPIVIVSLVSRKPVPIYLVGSEHRVRNYFQLLDFARVTAVSTLILVSTIAVAVLLLRQLLPGL